MGGETHTKPSGSSYPKMAAGPVGQQIHSIYKDRLGQFTSGGQYESQNLLGYVLRQFLSRSNRVLEKCTKVEQVDLIM